VRGKRAAIADPMTRTIDIALLGHGRFGRALAELAEDAGLTVGAWDASAEIPAHRQRGALAELCASADVVVLAVPVPAMRSVLALARPHLDPRQLLLDVGSVKVHPVAAMAEVLGDDIPWIGTHPLFGPTSLALAERPLRVVLCPNARHPQATARARAFYEKIGCWTIEQDPNGHDKAMAETHALAFFIAKGMLDAGVDTKVAFAPPSFQAIARTVDVVRSDAGHLFAAICAENPHAHDARKRLLDALSAAHGLLDHAGEPGQLAISIPTLPTEAPSTTSVELAETRDLIDDLDRELVELLARRAELSRRARKAKQKVGQPLHDATREADLLSARRRLASDRGLDEESIEDVFRAVLRFSRRIQG
jgi:prephenate dehydrogenase